MGKRMYSAAKQSRLSGPWSGASNTSGDSELATSLTKLRAKSRELCRDVSYAKRAKSLFISNIIGTGVRMQAQVYTVRNELNERVNAEIEEKFERWCAADSCHTGGRMDFASFERALIGQVFEAGEVFVRKHYQPFGTSRVPFSLELIEAERIADDLVSVPALTNSSNEVRLGVEVDSFYRPVAYYIRRRHPDDMRYIASTPDEVERVPAEQIIHLALGDRFPQTRGEPVMASVISTFRDIAGYVEAEITRARIQASTPWTIETPESVSSFGESQDDGSVEMTSEPGVAKRLNPGERMNAPSINSPNPSIEPFMRYLLRNVASGCCVTYESLSRDYSQSNYSSSRLALLDDRDLWRILQAWYIKAFREPVHRDWLRQSVLSGALKTIGVESYALDLEKFESVRFRPRGWGWVDPTKEVQAFKDAVRSGFMTLQDVLATSGADVEELMGQRGREMDLAEEYGVVLDSDAKFTSNAGLTQARPQGSVVPNPDAEPPPIDPPEPEESDDSTEEEPAARRVFSFNR